MLKRYLGTLFLFLVTIAQSNGQNSKITGHVADSSGNVKLLDVSVALLQGKDSFLIADVRTDKNGNFSFSNLNDTSGYILLFAFPDYADYTHILNMRNAAGGVLKLNKVTLIKRKNLLREVVIKSQIGAIKIKGDTTEYKADSFKLQANANVEDLLKQLPGLQVDQYGNITAQGQKVKRVLVDGEEFFSDDPTLVTRNLRADMIDKVQVYDRKSDAATFTGIDDGVREKTINLNIKAEKKNGVFGKVDAGAGSDEHYNVQAMLNFFRENRKLSAFTTTSNTGRVGLGAADKEKIGDSDDKLENYDGVGLPKATSGGLHYEQKWKEGKETINSNYKFSLTNVKGSQLTVSQNNLDTGIILGDRSFYFDNHVNNQKLNTTYTYKPDSSSTIRIYADAEVANVTNKDTSSTQNMRGMNQSIINTGLQYRDNDYNYKNYNINASWEKRLNNHGRTLSFYLRSNLFNDDAKGKSLSDVGFYNMENKLDSNVSLHLRKQMDDEAYHLSFKAIYTEMLAPKLSLVVNYEVNRQSSNEDKRSFNLNSNEPSGTIDSTFSSVLDADLWNNQGGLSLHFNSSKSNVKIGNNVSLTDMHVENTLSQLTFKKQFVNWSPQFTFNYKFSNYKMLDVNYFGKNVNPEKTQILPHAYNNSQLVMYIPNLDLRNSFSNSVTLNYKSSKISTQGYSGLYINYSSVSNPITLSLLVDPNSGVYTYQYANMSGYTNTNYSGRVFVSRKIRPLDVEFSTYGGINGGRMFSTIDKLVNKLNYNTFLAGIDLYKSAIRKYYVHISGNGGYSLNTYSLQPGSKNNYFFYVINPSIDIFFLKHFQLHTDANYTWQQSTRSFNTDYSRFIWNAWLGRNFFKNDQLVVKISCNDILNRNNGYLRTATNTFFSEDRYTTIRRFFMIGATWNFTKFSSAKD